MATLGRRMVACANLTANWISDASYVFFTSSISVLEMKFSWFETEKMISIFAFAGYFSFSKL